MATKQTFNYPFNITNADNYGQALKDIDNKINTLKKRVSYFDAFHISDSVVEEKNLDAQLSSLPVNQALVINTSPFIKQSVVYSPGDILLKMSNGEIVHIPSQTGGVYYPRAIIPQYSDSSKTTISGYTVEYSYSGSSPIDGSESNVDWEAKKDTEEGAVAEFSETIRFENLEKIDTGYIYGVWKTYDNKDSKTFTFTAYQSSVSENAIAWYVRPVVQFFLCKDEDNTPNEQIFIDYQLTLNETASTWTVTVSERLKNLWIKVK